MGELRVGDTEDEWITVRSRKGEQLGTRNMEKDKTQDKIHAAGNNIVSANKGKRFNHRHHDTVRGQRCDSYYFTNYPEDWGTVALWKMFARWGKVVDVFIPKKKNKTSRSFGFVRFIDVKDYTELEKRLDSIWIGTYKLRVNLTRYDRQNHKQKGDTATPKRFKGATTQVSKGLKYVEVVRGKFKDNERTKVNQKAIRGDEVGWSGWEYNVEGEDMAWLSKCYVGHLQNPDIGYMLQDRMLTEGITSVTVIPIDGNKMLLKVSEDEDFVQLVKDAEGYFDEWFSELAPWSP